MRLRVRQDGLAAYEVGRQQAANARELLVDALPARHYQHFRDHGGLSRRSARLELVKDDMTDAERSEQAQPRPQNSAVGRVVVV